MRGVGDLVLRARQPDKPFVEGGGEIGQHRAAVPLGIDGNEERLYVAGRRPDLRRARRPSR